VNNFIRTPHVIQHAMILLHLRPLANSAMMTTLTVHCGKIRRWGRGLATQELRRKNMGDDDTTDFLVPWQNISRQNISDKIYFDKIYPDKIYQDKTHPDKIY